MTQDLYYLQSLADTLECIKEHDGKNVTTIAKDVGYNGIIPRINEMIDHGLARKRGTVYGRYSKVVHLTRKGQEVLDMLYAVRERIKDPDGEDEIVKERYHRERGIE